MPNVYDKKIALLALSNEKTCNRLKFKISSLHLKMRIMECLVDLHAKTGLKKVANNDKKNIVIILKQKFLTEMKA